MDLKDVSYEGFAEFAATHPADQEINHCQGWKGCAVGAYARSLFPGHMKKNAWGTATDVADALRYEMPDGVYDHLENVLHAPETYGELMLLLVLPNVLSHPPRWVQCPGCGSEDIQIAVTAWGVVENNDPENNAIEMDLNSGMEYHPNSQIWCVNCDAAQYTLADAERAAGSRD